MNPQVPTFTRVLRLRLKDKHARALREQAFWVNQVWNYCNDLSFKVLQREHRFLSGFELQKFTDGCTKEGVPLHSQSVQAVAEEYATRRKQFKKAKLRWRVSSPTSSKYSLGWIPFKASALRYRNGQVHVSGLGPLSLWDSYGLSAYELGAGSFSEDTRGRWYLNVSVKVPVLPVATSDRVLGLDLGLKTAATGSAPGVVLEARHTHRLEEQLGRAQRAHKTARVKALNAKIKNRRKDALHQFSAAMVKDYGAIFIGNVSTTWQTAVGNGKSVLDAGWGELKTQLQYKGERAGRWVEVIDEAYSTQTCSACDARTGPVGREGLAAREWVCPCGAHHDRDQNAAINIAASGLIGVEARVTAARLERDAKLAKALERKTKLAANKEARAASRRRVTAAGHGRPVEGIPVLSA